MTQPDSKKYAIISHLYGNAQALDAIVHDCLEQSVDQIFLLGNFIGYGKQVKKCFDTIERIPDGIQVTYIQGSFENYIKKKIAGVDQYQDQNIQDGFKKAAEYTYSLLKNQKKALDAIKGSRYFHATTDGLFLCYGIPADANALETLKEEIGTPIDPLQLSELYSLAPERNEDKEVAKTLHLIAAKVVKSYNGNLLVHAKSENFYASEFGITDQKIKVKSEDTLQKLFVARKPFSLVENIAPYNETSAGIQGLFTEANTEDLSEKIAMMEKNKINLRFTKPSISPQYSNYLYSTEEEKRPNELSIIGAPYASLPYKELLQYTSDPRAKSELQHPATKYLIVHANVQQGSYSYAVERRASYWPIRDYITYNYPSSK